MNQSAEAVIPFSVGKCRSGWFSFQDISRNHYIVMPPRVPVQTRLHVVRIRLNGASQSQIARTIEITQATGNSIVNAFQDEGHIGYLERNCTRKATDEEDNAMVEATRKDPFITAGQIRDMIGPEVTDKLVRQRLCEAGLKNQTGRMLFLQTSSQTAPSGVRSGRSSSHEVHLSVAAFCFLGYPFCSHG